MNSSGLSWISFVAAPLVGCAAEGAAAPLADSKGAWAVKPKLDQRFSDEDEARLTRGMLNYLRTSPVALASTRKNRADRIAAHQIAKTASKCKGRA